METENPIIQFLVPWISSWNSFAFKPNTKRTEIDMKMLNHNFVDAQTHFWDSNKYNISSWEIEEAIDYFKSCSGVYDNHVALCSSLEEWLTNRKSMDAIRIKMEKRHGIH